MADHLRPESPDELHGFTPVEQATPMHERHGSDGSFSTSFELKPFDVFTQIHTIQKVNDEHQQPHQRSSRQPLLSASSRKKPRVTTSERLTAFLRNAGLRAVSASTGPFKSAPSEKAKYVVRTDLWLSLIRCWVHVIPLIGTVAIATFNLTGFYIGPSLQGPQGQAWQSFAQLLLQITAKVFELLIVASLAHIVLAVVRHELLRSASGLPLGLAVGHLKFSEVSYFWSAEFFGGMRGISGRRKAVIPLLMFACGLVAVFAGPAAATLLIPTLRDDWWAGGGNIWVLGNSSQIWPSVLDKSFIGGDYCESPDYNLITSKPTEYSGCVWNGYTTIADYFLSSHRNLGCRNITTNEGIMSRAIYAMASNVIVDTWGSASMAPLGMWTYIAAQHWYYSLFNSKRSQPPYYSTHNLKNRQRGGTHVTVASLIPAVRTRCTDYVAVSPNVQGSLETLDFPYLPQYDFFNGTSYLIESPTINNTIDHTSQWIQIPAGTTLLSNSSDTAQYPSAFLKIQVPGINETLWKYMCSIDARWAPGWNIVNNWDSAYETTYMASRPSTGRSYDTKSFGKEQAFLPNEEWHNVKLDIDWLNALTPEIGSVGSNLTTISNIVRMVGIDNSTTNLVTNWENSRQTLEMILAATVSDGMSRTGYSGNGGYISDLSYPVWLGNRKHTSQYYADILEGKGAVLPNPGDGTDPKNTTKLRFDVTVTGLAYKADSTAYYLALTVLFVHAILALTHTVIMLWYRRSSEAWDSVIDLLMLAVESERPLSENLKKTVAGVGNLKTMRTAACVRVRKVDADGEPHMQLILCEAGDVKALPGVDLVAYDKKY